MYQVRDTSLFKVNVISQLHILRVDAQNFEAASWVWNTDVHFAIETAKAAEGRVDGIGSIRRRHHDHVGAGFDAVHKRQKL